MATISKYDFEIKSSARGINVGESNYSQFNIQPWDIWEEYQLNPWDADIVKRVLRTKNVKGMSRAESRAMDYEKIIHICQHRLEMLKREEGCDA